MPTPEPRDPSCGGETCPRSIILVGLPCASELDWDEGSLLAVDVNDGCADRFSDREEQRRGNGSPLPAQGQAERAVAVQSRLRDDDETAGGAGVPASQRVHPRRTKRTRSDAQSGCTPPASQSQSRKRPRQAATAGAGAGAENSAQEGLPQLYEGAGTYVRYSGRALSLSLGGLSQSHCLNDDGSTCPGFYDESLALHRDMDLTVFNARLGQETAQLSQAVEEADAWVARSNLALSAALPPPLPGDFTPLDQLPRLCASSPYPHVPPTVNLIAGVLAVQPRTRVRTRYGKDMDFIEMLLGDETVRDAAGLTMTFWLDPSGVPPDGRAGDDVSSPTNTLESYHRGDVLYLRHVALRVFEGRVYAQSLRNNATKVHLYHRWIYTSSAPGAAAGSRPGSGCEPGRYTTKMLMGVARDGREDAHAQRTGDAATAADAGWRCHPHLRKLAAVVDFVKRTIASTVNVEGESSLAA